MYQVMIVDDEPIVRESLKTFPWMSHQCELAACADNGYDALTQLQHQNIDIIISDIRMPQLNGLDFANKVREINPNVEIILLTGYAEFEYAKRALTLGIREYLLKPFRFEDVAKALASCIQELEIRRKKLQKEKQTEEKLKTVIPMLTSQLYQDLLDGKNIDYSSQIKACNIQQASYIVVSTQRDMQENSTLDMALHDQIRKLTDGIEREFYLAPGKDIVSCIICFNPKYDNSFCEQATLHFCQMLQTAVAETLGSSISFGISLPNRNLLTLHQLKKQSVQALNYRQSLGNSSIVLYSDIQETTGRKKFDIGVYEKRIQKCIAQNQKNELEQLYQDLVKELLICAQGDFHYVKKNLINLVILSFRFAESRTADIKNDYKKIELLFQCESIENLKEETWTLLEELLPSEPTTSCSNVSELVKDYINHHISEDISLEQLSQNLCYSTAYLSRLIKKSTGQTFSELLQNLRMQKAQELLTTTDDKVNVVASKAGYNDISYFISMFKKKTGVTPTEYRSLSRLGVL